MEARGLVECRALCSPLECVKHLALGLREAHQLLSLPRPEDPLEAHQTATLAPVELLPVAQALPLELELCVPQMLWCKLECRK